MAPEDLLPAWAWPAGAPTGARDDAPVTEVGPLSWESGETGAWRLAVKENIAVAGRPLTAGSPARQGFPPEPADAPIVGRLRAAGATVVGQARMHELAFGVTGRNQGTGTVANAAVPGGMPGGSSSGSAAAVAAGLADVALGTDTGGSCRIPAALQGVVGFKASRTLGTDGVLPLARSLDHLGWLTRDVAGAIRVAEALGIACCTGPFTLGVLRPPVTDEVAAAVDHAVARLGATELTWPHHDLVVAVTTTIMYAEAARALAPAGVGADVAARLELGATVTPDQERAARDLGRRLVSAWGALPADVVVQPTCGSTAPAYAESADPGVTARLGRGCRLDDLAGTPAVSIPIPGCPRPVGLHLSGRSDGALLAAAAQVATAIGSPRTGAATR